LKIFFHAAMVAVICSALIFFACASEQSAPQVQPPPTTAPAVVPTENGTREAVLAFGKACDEIDFGEAIKFVVKAELERIMKSTLSNLNIIKNLDENMRKEAVAQLGIEDKDLSLSDEQLFIKIKNALMRQEKATTEAKGEKWGLNFTFVSEKIEGDNAVVVVKVSGGNDTEIPMVKENGAWKLASLPEKEEAPAPKKSDETESVLTPSETFSKFFDWMMSGNGKGAVSYLSTELIKKMAQEIRESKNEIEEIDLPEEIMKDDKKLLIAHLDVAIENAKILCERCGDTFEYNVKIIGEQIEVEKSTVKVHLKSFFTEDDLDIPFIKENDKWKMTKWFLYCAQQ